MHDELQTTRVDAIACGAHRWSVRRFPAVAILLACCIACRAATPTVETWTVRGASMSGILEPGTQVSILRDHYETHPVERGDVVVHGRQNPIIKVARGIPGDRFDVVVDAAGIRSLFLNGEVARTSRGEPYVLDASAAQMLGLYVRDYAGIIPTDAVLILGNLPNGSRDSSRVGLVHRKDLLGKVVMPGR